MNRNECQARIRYNADRLARALGSMTFPAGDWATVEDVTKSLYALSFEGDIVLANLPGMGYGALERLKEMAEQYYLDFGLPGDKGLVIVLQDQLERPTKPIVFEESALREYLQDQDGKCNIVAAFKAGFAAGRR